MIATVWRLILVFLAAVCGMARAAPQTATFATEVSTVTWPLAELDARLPADWRLAAFLVIEFRSSTSQRFELGLVNDQGTVSRRIHPFANVWLRASIPLQWFREGPGEAGDYAATVNRPRATYWASLDSGGRGSLENVRALSLTLRYPVRAATIEVRKVELASTDPGDAVLDGAQPLVDDFGQYRHADWPGKAASFAALQREWAQENRMLVPRSEVPPCRYGGFATDRRRATGFFRVEPVGGRWWFVDPQGCRFWSAGVNGAGGEPPSTAVLNRSKLFASIPTSAQIATPGAEVDPLRDPVSFYLANLQKRFGADWRSPAAQVTARRLRAWGLNTTYGAALNHELTVASMRQPYVLELRGWQHGDGAILGMPDVYAPAFASRVDRDLAQQLASRKDDPWMLGYFIGNEPPWPGRENELVDRVLAGPASELQKRFKAGLVRGDTPAARQAVVRAAFARYLEVVNAAARRHDPNHLNLGIRFVGAPADEVMALAKGFDVFSMSQYRWTPPQAAIDRAHAITRLPILITGFHFGVPERGLAPGLTQVLSQSERGVAYSYFVENAAAHPAVVGTHWYQWVDQPVTGRPDGENYNNGWVDVTDRPYPELVAAAKATHARLDALHSGKLAPTTRRARASDFGTPQDSIYLGMPADRRAAAVQ